MYSVLYWEYKSMTEVAKGAADILAVREEIDKVDSELVKLLNRRMQLALAAGALKLAEKRPIFNIRRENEVLEHIMAENEGPISNEDLLDIFLDLMRLARNMQHRAQSNQPESEPEDKISYYTIPRHNSPKSTGW